MSSIIERKAIRRGTFRSVRDLDIKVRDFMHDWNSRRHPFVWTNFPDGIASKIDRKKTSLTHH